MQTAPTVAKIAPTECATVIKADVIVNRVTMVLHAEKRAHRTVTDKTVCKNVNVRTKVNAILLPERVPVRQTSKANFVRMDVKRDSSVFDVKEDAIVIVQDVEN